MPAFAPGTSHDVVATTPDGTTATLIKGWVSDFLDVPGGQQFHSFVVDARLQRHHRRRRRRPLRRRPGHQAPADGRLPPEGQARPLLRRRPPAPASSPTSPARSSSPPGSRPSPPRASRPAAAAASSARTTSSPGARWPSSCSRPSTARPTSRPTCTGVFDDVVCPSAPAVDFIEQLAAEQITGGCQASPPLYCPDNSSTRGQMAVFIVEDLRASVEDRNDATARVGSSGCCCSSSPPSALGGLDRLHRRQHQRLRERLAAGGDRQREQHGRRDHPVRHPGRGRPHDPAPVAPARDHRNDVTIDGYTQPGASPNTLADGERRRAPHRDRRREPRLHRDRSPGRRQHRARSRHQPRPGHRHPARPEREATSSRATSSARTRRERPRFRTRRASCSVLPATAWEARSRPTATSSPETPPTGWVSRAAWATSSRATSSGRTAAEPAPFRTGEPVSRSDSDRGRSAAPLRGHAISSPETSTASSSRAGRSSSRGTSSEPTSPERRPSRTAAPASSSPETASWSAARRPVKATSSPATEAMGSSSRAPRTSPSTATVSART